MSWRWRDARRAPAPALAGAVGLTLCLAACRGEPASAVSADVVARLGPEEVRYPQFEAYVAATVGDDDDLLPSGVLTRLFDRFLDEELLIRLAVERGVAAPGASRRQALDALLAGELGPGPGEPEVTSYYQGHRDSFARPERVRLRQILVEDRESAERVRAEIAAGADFATVARRVSRDPSAGAGGLQGELSRADLPQAFAEVIFALAPGEVSRVIEAEYGYHLFQVTERLPAEVVPLAQARDEIARQLKRERADRLLTSLVGEARDRYDVEVYARNLPFDYEGVYSGSKN